MTSTRLVLAAASIAAALTGVGPTLSHGAAADPLRLTPGAVTKLVVPPGATTLVGAPAGSPALADRTRVTVTRVSDGATMFIGSLATLRSLPVLAGSQLVVRASQPAGFAGLGAATQLGWS